MCGRTVTYTSKSSVAVLAKLLGILEDRGPTSMTDLVAAMEMHPITLGGYLRHLASLGKAHCSQRARQYQGGSKSASWAPGDGPTDDGVDHLPRKVIVRKEWEPNHVRMAMECYLFGVPAVWKEAL